MHSSKHLVNQVGTAMQQQQPGATVTTERSEARETTTSTLLATRLETVYQFCLTNLKPVLMEYWPEFVNKYPELDMQQWAIREYAKQMVDEGVTNSRQIIAGIAKACKQKYRPRPTEFAKLCKPTAEELGIPSLRQTYDEVVARHGKFRNKPFEFSHRVLEIIDERIGFRVHQMRDADFMDLLKGEYEYWLDRAMTGDLPQPRPALEYSTPQKARIDSYVSKHGLPQLGSDTLSQKIKELGVSINRNRKIHISQSDDKVA